MKKILILILALAGQGAAMSVTAAPVSVKPDKFADSIKSLSLQAGLFDLYVNPEQARLLLGIHSFSQPFLLTTSLPYGLGSNDVGLDRGQPGNVRMVEFRRAGPRVLLVQLNNRFIASSNSAEERMAVTEAFAESVLWAGEVIAEKNIAKKSLTEKSPAKSVLIDFSSFLLSDHHGITSRLASSKQGNYQIDEKRSALAFEHSKSFPDNTELEAMLTFSGAGEGDFVNQVAVDAQSLTMRQHISMVKLPDNNFSARIYHPASGGIDVGFYDFSTPLANSLDVRYQARHRLHIAHRTADGAGEVEKPIVYYLDRGTPEPVRSALLEGANWWQSAFAKAGFKNAYRVELMPVGVDAMDSRYNTIQWVHRATRGWSYGSFLADPRSGEIIKGAVTLGSQRVRQDILIAESLLAPYGKANEAQLKKMAEDMSLARLRQLAAHEVGHTLGFAHNFAASRLGNGSVMDYPYPMLSVNANGDLDLNRAYGVGLGAWDDFLVAHAYSEFSPTDEKNKLAQLRAGIFAAGFAYISDPDARQNGASHPDGLLWDFGPDSLATFDQLMVARRKALNNFSLSVLPPERQIGELEARLVPLYLLHRYQSEAVARLLGGVSYQYSIAADQRAGTQALPSATQRAALQKLMQTLHSDELTLPAPVLNLLTPPANGYERSREYFISKTAPVFDALAAAEAATAQTCQFLFDASRLNRLFWQHAVDSAQPDTNELMQTVFVNTWQRRVDDVNGAAAVQIAVNWTVLDAVFNVLDSGQLHAGVDAELRAQLRAWQLWLEKNSGSASSASSRTEAARNIEQYLRDPSTLKRRAPPVIPPGAPI